MRLQITRYEEELLVASRQFLAAAESRPVSFAILEEHGFSTEQRERGRLLIAHSEAAFECERNGTAWNFLTFTPWARRREAVDWFVATRWRRFRHGFVAAERAISSPSLLEKATRLWRGVDTAFSGLVEDPATLARDLWRAGSERPQNAPPPKDTTLVELQGWYEHWRLLAQRVFRGRDDLLAPFGLSSGKAPPRLRGKLAQIRFGEGAASRDARFPAA